jgi:hypothetical protein
MLFIGKQDAIPGLEFETQCHEVNGMAGVQGKDDFPFRPGVDELLD